MTARRCCEVISKKLLQSAMHWGGGGAFFCHVPKMGTGIEDKL